jgi:serine/threonine-protein kinase
MLSPSSGQQLSARYTLRERLSSGASGETWRARDAARDRDVVVKFLPQPLAAEDAVLHSLRLELEAARSLDPRMVAASEALEREGGQAYLLREYVPGRDLSALRGESWRRIVPPVAQVADALMTLHERAIVHRDLKPSNVVLRPDGSATLIDLGAAALAGSAAANLPLSRYGASPQQLAGESPTPADDVYGLGALLYELLGGYPPFYPNFSRERVLREPVAPLKPAQPAPPGLIELVMRLLAKSPAERPADVAEVARSLRALEREAEVSAPESAAQPAVAPVATIVRPIVRAATTAEHDATRSSGERRRVIMIGGAFVALIVVAVGVLLILPRFAYRAAPVTTTRPSAPGASQRSPEAEAEIDLKLLAEQMQEAERIRDVYDALYPSLEKRAAVKWAAQAFAAAREHGEQARRHFAAREFLQARDAYTAGVDELQKISDLVQPTLAEQLRRGNEALDAGQSTMADAAFALALDIDPGNKAATRGRERAKTLDSVNALVAQATNAERAGDLSLAAQRYEEAIKLDADTRAAHEGLTRVRGRIANDEFAAVMSLGLRELEAGKLAEARNAFERAGRLRPGAPEVKDALARVSESGRQNSIATHRAQGERYERADRWVDALAEYEAALKLDPKLEFANAGRERLAPRVELLREIDTLLASQDRLMSAAVRDQARALVAEAERFSASSATLQKKSQALAARLAQYEMPVRVALLSNSETEVVVYKVGSMGVFDRREIELLPGTYTVVGKRVGFRDVRRELTVQPGQSTPTLDIRCEEPI